MPTSGRSTDLRKGRFSERGRIYLLTSVVHGRQPIFVDWQLGRLVVAEFQRAEHEALRIRWPGLSCQIIFTG